MIIFRRCRVLTDFIDIVAYLTIPVEQVEDVSVEENTKKCDKGEVDSADIKNLKYMQVCNVKVRILLYFQLYHNNEEG